MKTISKEAEKIIKEFEEIGGVISINAPFDETIGNLCMLSECPENLICRDCPLNKNYRTKLYLEREEQ